MNIVPTEFLPIVCNYSQVWLLLDSCGFSFLLSKVIQDIYSDCLLHVCLYAKLKLKTLWQPLKRERDRGAGLFRLATIEVCLATTVLL
ncbi:unnamed protein product [Camellia sinensis]